MDIKITISEEDARFFQSFCTLRPTRLASDLLTRVDRGESLSDDIENGTLDACIQDLDAMGDIVERLRQKVVQEIYIVQQKRAADAALKEK